MSTFQIQVAKRGLVTLPKELRESNHIQDGDILTLVDLGGAFLLTPRVSQVDKAADQLAEQWRAQGESLESMLQTLREVREDYASEG